MGDYPGTTWGLLGDYLDRQSASPIWTSRSPKNAECLSVNGKLAKVGVYKSGRKLNGTFLRWLPPVITSRSELHARLAGDARAPVAWALRLGHVNRLMLAFRS